MKLFHWFANLPLKARVLSAALVGTVVVGSGVAAGIGIGVSMMSNTDKGPLASSGNMENSITSDVGDDSVNESFSFSVESEEEDSFEVESSTESSSNEDESTQNSSSSEATSDDSDINSSDNSESVDDSGDNSESVDDSGDVGHEHDFSKQIVESSYIKTEAACESKAVYYYACECGARGTETYEYGLPMEHDKQSHEAKAPTCVSVGWNAYETCSRCDYTTYVEIPIGGDHVWDEGVFTKNPTCTEAGVKAYTCTVCKTASKTEEVGALKHDTQAHEAKAPTCVSVGWNAYETCSRCDYTTYEELPATGVHVWDAGVIAIEPTCIKTGVKVSNCTGCEEIQAESVPATGHHVWNEGEITRQPTCTQEGEKTVTCTQCNTATETQSIEKAPHVYTDDWKSDETHHWRECACGEPTDKAEHFVGDNGGCSVCEYRIGSTQGVLYEVVDEYARVVGYEGTPTVVFIADTYEGKPVTEIAKRAFNLCTSLTNVVIGDNILTIGEKAFHNCKNLTIYCEAERKLDGWDTLWNDMERPVVWGYSEYTMVNGVMYAIQSGEAEVVRQSCAIERAEIAEKVTCKEITYSVTSIAYNAFYECDKLTDVTLGGNVVYIGVKAFYGCTALTGIVLSNNLEMVDLNAFEGCSNLMIYCEMTSVPAAWNSGWNYSNRPVILGYTDYVTADNVKYGIKDGKATVVKQVWKDAEVQIPATVQAGEVSYDVVSIGADVFKDYTALKSIVIGDNLRSIGANAFKNCVGLTSITIGNGVETMEESAFSGCTGLADIVLPDSVKTIGAQAFYNCANLVRLTIGKGVASIGDYAFQSCVKLTSVTMPDSVISIGSFMFWHCTALKSVSMGKGVTWIGKDLFFGCDCLESIAFADTSDWYRTKKTSDWTNKANGKNTSVADDGANVDYFKTSYFDYYWYKA